MEKKDLPTGPEGEGEASEVSQPKPYQWLINLFSEREKAIIVPFPQKEEDLTPFPDEFAEMVADIVDGNMEIPEGEDVEFRTAAGFTLRVRRPEDEAA